MQSSPFGCWGGWYREHIVGGGCLHRWDHETVVLTGLHVQVAQPIREILRELRCAGAILRHQQTIRLIFIPKSAHGRFQEELSSSSFTNGTSTTTIWRWALRFSRSKVKIVLGVQKHLLRLSIRPGNGYDKKKMCNQSVVPTATLSSPISQSKRCQSKKSQSNKDGV